MRPFEKRGNEQRGATAGQYRFDLALAFGHRTGSALASSNYGWAASATGLYTPHPVAWVVGWWSE
jgi:hypothetical protein